MAVRLDFALSSAIVTCFPSQVRVASAKGSKIMGLSKEERKIRVVWSIRRLQGLIPNLESGESKHHEETAISPLIRRMWPTLLSDDGDGGFWIFGTDMSSCHLDGKNLFHIAMISHAEEVTGLIKETLEKSSSVLDEKDDDWISDYEFGSNFLPDLGSIFANSRDGRYNSAVVMVYLEIENCQYALNRYHDEFAEKFTAMRDLCAEIQGRCFCVMSANRIFYEGYLLNVIAKRVFSGPWDSEKNIAFRLIKEFNLHHNWHVRERSDHEIAKIMVMWKKIQNVDDMSNQDRVLAILEIAGEAFGDYDHMRKKLIDILNLHNVGKPKSECVGIGKVEAALKRLIAAHKVKMSENKERYRHESYCYAMDGFDMTLDDIRDAVAFDVNKAKRRAAKYNARTRERKAMEAELKREHLAERKREISGKDRSDKNSNDGEFDEKA